MNRDEIVNPLFNPKEKEKLKKLGYSEEIIHEFFVRFSSLNIKSLNFLLENEHNQVLEEMIIDLYKMDLKEIQVKLAICDLTDITKDSILNWIFDHENDIDTFQQKYLENVQEEKQEKKEEFKVILDNEAIDENKRVEEIVQKVVEAGFTTFAGVQAVKMFPKASFEEILDIVTKKTKSDYKYPYDVLTNIGFEEKESLETLVKTNGDINSSLDILLTKKVPPKVQKIIDSGHSLDIARLGLIEANQDVNMALDYIYSLKMEEMKRLAPPEDQWKFNPEIPPKEKRVDLTNIGKDAFFTILSFTDKRDNLNISLTCSTLSKVSKSNIVWKGYVGEQFIKKQKVDLEFRKDVDTSLNLDDVEESEGIRVSYLNSQKEKLIKSRKNGLEYLRKEYDNYDYSQSSTRLSVWIIFLVSSFVLTAISGIVLPLALDFFNSSYWWVFGYAPLFLVGVFFVFINLDESSRIKNRLYPHILLDKSQYQKEDLDITFIYYPFFSIPILFLWVGLILLIPPLPTIGLWRIYLLPWFAILLYLIYIQIHNSLRLSIIDEFPAHVYVTSIFSITLYILLCISYWLIASKLDNVPFFIKIPWSVTFIPLYLIYLIVPFYIAFLIYQIEIDNPFLLFIPPIFFYILSFSFAISTLLLGLKLDSVFFIYYIAVISPIYLTFILLVIISALVSFCVFCQELCYYITVVPCYYIFYCCCCGWLCC